jgi:hypothetical protein
VSEQWAEAVRRFTRMSPSEMLDLQERTRSQELDASDWLLLAVDALDQAGLDVERVALVSR